MGEVKWYRVIDPLSPLYGCDVRGYSAECVFGPDDGLVIKAMRRVDIFVGDRPFQLIAPQGETLGLVIDSRQLEPSPLQDETVELATDLPYGEFLEEVEDERGDRLRLHSVAYENAYQVALTSPEGVIVTRTIQNLNDELIEIREMFARGDDVDDIKFKILRSS